MKIELPNSMIPIPKKRNIEIKEEHRQLIKLNCKKELWEKKFYEQKEMIINKALQCLKGARTTNYYKQWKRTVIKYFKKYQEINKKAWPDWTYIVLPSPTIIGIVKKHRPEKYKNICIDLWIDYTNNKYVIYTTSWKKRKEMMKRFALIIYNEYLIDETYEDYDWRAECLFKSIWLNKYIL